MSSPVPLVTQCVVSYRSTTESSKFGDKKQRIISTMYSSFVARTHSDVTLFPGSSHEDFTIEYSSSSEHVTVSEEASTDLCSKKYKSDDEAEHSSLKDVYLLTRSPCQGRRKAADWIIGHTRHFPENTCYSDKVTQWLASLPPERQVKKRKREGMEEGGESKRARCVSGSRRAALPYSQTQRSSNCHKRKHRNQHDLKRNNLPVKRVKSDSSKYHESVPSKPVHSHINREYDNAWCKKRKAYDNESWRDQTKSQNHVRDRNSSLTNGKRRRDRSDVKCHSLPVKRLKSDSSKYYESVARQPVNLCINREYDSAWCEKRKAHDNESWRDLRKSQNRVGDRNSSMSSGKRCYDRSDVKYNSLPVKYNSLPVKRVKPDSSKYHESVPSQPVHSHRNREYDSARYKKRKNHDNELWRNLTKSQNHVVDRKSLLANEKRRCDHSVYLPHRQSPLEALYKPLEKKMSWS